MSSLASLPEEIIKRKIVSLPPHTPSEFFLSGAIPNCLTRWEHVRIAILSPLVLIAGEFKGAIRRLGMTLGYRPSLGVHQPRYYTAIRFIVGRWRPTCAPVNQPGARTWPSCRVTGIGRRRKRLRLRKSPVIRWSWAKKERPHQFVKALYFNQRIGSVFPSTSLIVEKRQPGETILS